MIDWFLKRLVCPLNSLSTVPFNCMIPWITLSILWKSGDEKQQKCKYSHLWGVGATSILFFKTFFYVSVNIKHNFKRWNKRLFPSKMICYIYFCMGTVKFKFLNIFLWVKAKIAENVLVPNILHFHQIFVRNAQFLVHTTLERTLVALCIPWLI